MRSERGWTSFAMAPLVAVAMLLSQTVAAAPVPPPPPPPAEAKPGSPKPESSKAESSKPESSKPGKPKPGKPKPGTSSKPAPSSDTKATPGPTTDASGQEWPEGLAPVEVEGDPVKAEAARKRAASNERAYNKTSAKKKGGKKATARVTAAVDAYEEAFENDPNDRASLESAAALLGRHLDHLDAVKSSRDPAEFELRLQRINDKLAELNQAEVEAAAAAQEAKAAKKAAEAEQEEEAAAAAPPPPRTARPRKFEWGYERPAARWKWAGVGLSLTVGVAGLVLGIVGRARSKPGGPLERDAFTLAAASLSDADDGNDVDPGVAGNICQTARQGRDGMPGVQVNPSVADVCTEADNWETISVVGYAGMGVGLVGAIVFTTLLFVHRGAGNERARVTPTPRGLRVRF